MLAVDKTSTDDEARGASFSWAFNDLVRPAGLQYSDVVGVLAPMLAMARLLPRATESVPLGFFDIDRELTVQNFRALMAALVNFLLVSYRNYNLFGKMYFNSRPVAIGTYDRVKYLLMKIDNETYYNVID